MGYSSWDRVRRKAVRFAPSADAPVQPAVRLSLPPRPHAAPVVAAARGSEGAESPARLSDSSGEATGERPTTAGTWQLRQWRPVGAARCSKRNAVARIDRTGRPKSTVFR